MGPSTYASRAFAVGRAQAAAPGALVMAEAVSEQTSLMRKSYQDNGYVIGKQVFSDDLLSGLRQSLKSVLDKSPQNGADPQSSLDEIILRREVQDHNLVYRAAQSVGS